MELGEDHYHALYNNSHFFVCWAKTGAEHSLAHVIDEFDFDEGQHFPLNPILSYFDISSLADINPGDHVMFNSRHHLVNSVCTDGGRISTYTTDIKGFVTNNDIKLCQSNTIVRVDYDQQSNFYHPAKSLERATDEMAKKSKWNCSDHFVAMMKCGRKHVITEKCLFEAEVEPIGCTPVTPHMAVDVGDRLLVRGTFGKYQSVLVYSCIDECTIVSMPNIHSKCLMGRINLHDYNDVYRVNYRQTLPIEEVFKRCSSSKGKQMLIEGGIDGASRFILWAKVGREISLTAAKVLQTQQIAEVRPWLYKKVMNVSSISVGDHLFIPYPAYRWHFLVSKKIQDSSDCTKLFKLTYFLSGSVKESDEVLDPHKNDIFKVVYPEEYSPSLAVKRAKLLVGKVSLNPMARMWFVRWVKTGSDEGLEIDFLKRHSLPVCKSRIACFTQLDPGDYIVVDKGRFSPRRHFLVTSVLSPNECFVIGSWSGKVTESKICLDEGIPHKIVYEENSCLSAAESIQRARDAVLSPSLLKHTRRKFVNFVKTTDATDVDVENLPDDRLLLKRERINSATAADIKPGDHLEVPVKISPRVMYRNLVVKDVVGEMKLRVMCVNPRRGESEIVEMDFDLMEGGGDGGVCEVYRVKYVERVGAHEGLDMLQRFSMRTLSRVDRSTSSEHFLSLATVGQPISLQLEPHLFKALQHCKRDIRRPVTIDLLRSASVETSEKASVNIAFKLGSHVSFSRTRIGEIIGIGPGINLLTKAPFFGQRIYRLNRLLKFNQITEDDYKRGVIQQSFTSANTVLGAAAGAMIGQVAIPVPIVGAAVGGALGTIGGTGIGHLEGWAASKLVRDAKAATLPCILNLHYLEIPEE